MTERAAVGPGSASDFTLGEWLVQPSLNRITRGEETIRLRPQLMNLLVCLAARAAHTVSREEILAVVWPGQYIADTGLARCIAELRQALGDTAGQDSKYIETIPKRGYRLIAPVGAVEAQAAISSSVFVPQPAVPPHSAVMQEAAPAGQTVGPSGVAGDGTGAGPRPHSFRRRAAMLVGGCGVLVLLGVSLAWRSLRPPTVERDTLVIAFENGTGETIFDDALRLALSTQLEQSPALRVVTERRVREELGFMNRPSDTPITRGVALEVCQRVGAKAVVAGSLASLGRHYAVGLEGVACESGEVIGREQVEAAGKEQVLGALGQAVSSIRARLGESVASIRRYDVPIVRATTSSLDALKAFSQGDYARARGEDDDAIRFFRRAIELDPSFAQAHVRLGLQLMNAFRDGEGVEEIRRAYAVRDHVSDAERFYITAFYEDLVLRDHIKCVEPLESWRDAYPRSAVSRFSLASMYGRIGRYDQALAEVREALRFEPNHTLATVVLVETLRHLGRIDEARRIGEEEIAAGRASVILRSQLAALYFEAHDPARLKSELDWADATASAATVFLPLQASMARFEGKMREASRFTARTIALAEQRGDGMTAAGAALDEAAGRALTGEVREPVAICLAALQKARTPLTVIRAALALAWAGDLDRAEQFLNEYKQMPDVTTGSDPEFKPPVLASITLGRGLPESALEVLAPLTPYERGWRFNFVPTYVRGLALLRLKRFAEAISQFDRIVNQRGAIPDTFVYPLAVLQSARAKSASGDGKGARAAYERFLTMWKAADADLPVLTQAREELARLPR